VLLDFGDEVPHFRTALRILEAEGIVDAIWFCPYDKRLWK